MKFERYRFLEVFDQERMIDEAAGISEYTLFSDDIIFILTISSSEDSARIQITQKDLSKPVADFKLKRVSNIVCDEKQVGFVNLLFCRDEKVDPSFYIERVPNPFLTVRIKPHISISYDFEQ